ncbi:Phosphoserine phosphatase RsbU [Tsuneonella dongtanensis]|uniref:Phosphoserine phosphatase RsbU n=1 Tax=Tsuneonella dongtanensis TaxID=692370 RepID=A0A1B2AH35_9SPHN|nr:CHASE2 domain-containing protein [Tsuneonella dongtanensis]ANY21395.1 Phosphoserine phosphatase RsbU [Tsuneonella dongtanensis]
MRARRLAGFAVLVGGLAGLLIGLALGDWTRRTLFDAFQRTAPREIAAEQVAVVLIDNASLETVGPWPWPRYHMARLTEQIARAGPKAIALDILFPTPDAFGPRIFASLYPELSANTVEGIERLTDMDEAFAQVLGSAPVLLPRVGVESGGIDPAQLMVDPEVAGTPPPDTLRTPQVLTSLPQLDDVSLAHALINGPPDSDGIVRRVPLTVVAGDRPMAGMAVELARIALKAPAMQWRGGALVVGPKVLPADRSGSLQLRMGLFPDAAIYRADEVLAGHVPVEALRNKVVLVGLSADGTSDIVPTPVSTTEIGVLVQAQAVDAILTGGWLSRPGWIWWAELGAALTLLVLVLFAGGTRRYWLLAPAGAIAIALPFAAYLLFDRANLLFDPVWPLLTGAGATIAMWTTLYLLARAERTRLAAALVDQRVAAAEQEGELRAARRIQLGMVPSAERLAGLDPRVEVGAVLRPAKSVGGDFYDAAMVGPDQMLIVIGDVTGKGVPAALYMALSKALSKSILRRSGSALGKAMQELNRNLMDEADEEMGVTLLVAMLDCSTGSLVLVNAGHENPLLVRTNGTVETVPLRGGPPLCVVDFAYPEEAVKLSPGETIVLLTDGATEAQNEALEFFGIEGVIAALSKEGDMRAGERAEDLADRVREFEGDTVPSDDLTIVALRYCGSRKPDLT